MFFLLLSPAGHTSRTEGLTVQANGRRTGHFVHDEDVIKCPLPCRDPVETLGSVAPRHTLTSQERQGLLFCDSRMRSSRPGPRESVVPLGRVLLRNKVYEISNGLSNIKRLIFVCSNDSVIDL